MMTDARDVLNVLANRVACPKCGVPVTWFIASTGEIRVRAVHAKTDQWLMDLTRGDASCGCKLTIDERSMLLHDAAEHEVHLWLIGGWTDRWGEPE